MPAYDGTTRAISARSSALSGHAKASARSGATAWTDSAKLRANVAHASLNTKGQGQIGATDPDGTYGAMIESLACEITDDFRTHYVLRKVRKGEVQTASAE